MKSVKNCKLQTCRQATFNLTEDMMKAVQGDFVAMRQVIRSLWLVSTSLINVTNRRLEESQLRTSTPCWCLPGWLPRVTEGAACWRRTGRRPSPWRWRGERGWLRCRPGREQTLQTESQCISEYLHFCVTVNFHSGLSRLQPKLYKKNIKPVIKEHFIVLHKTE